MDLLPVSFNNSHDLYRCYMPFLKLGGIFCCDICHYPMGERLQLQLTLPDGSVQQINGQVVWLALPHEQASYQTGSGVAFLSDNLALRAKIESLISNVPSEEVPLWTM